MQRLFFQKSQNQRQNLGVNSLTPARRRSKAGQAMIEYVLLVTFVTLIFGSIFSIIRRGIYFFWICELYPRVASVSSCGSAPECFEMLKTGANTDLTPPACVYE